MYSYLQFLINIPAFSPRLSSLRHASMRRPSTSCCMNPMMGGVLTMPCWRPQGALQDDLIIWMKTRSANELNEFVGFISNDRMTAHTTTSDLSPLDLSACVSDPGQSLHHACALQHPAPLCLTSTLILPAFSRRLLWDKCHSMVCSGEMILCVFVSSCHLSCVVWQVVMFVSHNNFYHCYCSYSARVQRPIGMDVCIQHCWWPPLFHLSMWREQNLTFPNWGRK